MFSKKNGLAPFSTNLRLAISSIVKLELELLLAFEYTVKLFIYTKKTLTYTFSTSYFIRAILFYLQVIFKRMSKVAIVGLQWGDEGKGKFVDYFAGEADVIVRFQGGNNAGHTIVHNNKSYKLSVLPSGILHKDKISYIGPGVVLDLEALTQEIQKLEQMEIKVSEKNLKIAENVTIILPLYKKLDILLESLKGNNKIGTTGRGISFAYQDHVGRRGVRLCDLYHDKYLSQQINCILDFYAPLLEKHDINFNIESEKKDIYSYIDKYKNIYQKYMAPPNFLSFFLGKRILFEGAQGAMLDVTFGTYPFVTSSNTLAPQSFIGGGCGGKLDKIFGVTKAYCTRVGSGPFPTEDFTEVGELLQKNGAEYGTVTGRKRRCGYLDLVALKFIINLSGITNIILTKIDVLNNFKTIKICTSYELEGKPISYFPSILQEKIVPVYTEMPGWGNGYAFDSFESLPFQLKSYIRFIEDFVKIPVSVLSFGPDRNQTLNLSSV